MDLKDLLKSPKGTYNTNYIKANFPEHYEKIIKMPGERFLEKLYQYINNESEHICAICGRPTRFRNMIIGYNKYCSAKCACKGDERQEKIRLTTLKRYGVENVSQAQEIKEKKLQTITEHYGNFGWGSKIITAKSNVTIKERYGVENISQSPEIKDKKRQTEIEHFGVTSHMQLPEYKYNLIKIMTRKYGNDYHTIIKEASKNKTKEYIQKKYQDFIDYTDDGLWKIRCPHPECNKCHEKFFITGQQMYNDRCRWHSETCTRLLEPNATMNGTSIELFVRTILDKYHIEYITNDRSIISPKELDIYIPSLKIGIECNGIYWHSSEFKTSSYHKNKYLLCKEKGIQLLTLWEDWIINKPQIIESILISKLGLCSNTIYARKCVIREVNSKICNEFLNVNHIQGTCKSSIRYGLYYNNELVSIMCFSKRSKLSGPKQQNNNEWELIRFCNKLNFRVIGGAGRLLHHFIIYHDPKYIISFSCNDISDGGLYKKLNFNENSLNQSYWYIQQDTWKRYHRSSFTKKNIWKQYNDLDKNLTETQMMNQLPYWRIYDSGTTQWKLSL